MIDAP